MPRPTLQLGTWGRIRRATVDGVPTAYARFRDWDGVTRPIQRSGRSEAAAERALIAAMKDRATPTGGLLDRESKFSELASAWLATVDESDRADTTKSRYRDLAERMLVPGLQSVRMRELTTPLLDTVLGTARKKHGAASVKTARSVLVQMCAYAVRKGALDTNVAEGTDTIQLKKKVETALTVDDVRAIRALLVKRDSTPDRAGRKRYTQITDVADCYMGTGARTNEVLALKWDVISADCRTVELRRTVVEIDGKLDIQDKPKTDSSWRTATVPDHVANMLLQRRVNATGDLVFPSSRGTVQQDGNLMRMWADALKGSPYADVTPVRFRKAVATLLAEKVGADAAADQLGHFDASVTRKHYIKKRKAGPVEARDVLAEMFG